MKRALVVTVLTSGVMLGLARGSHATLSPHELNCGPGYVRRSVRVPERKHGRIVRHRHKIIYTRVQRCVKVHTTATPAPTPTRPSPSGPPGNPAPTSTGGTSTTTSGSTTTPAPPPPPAPAPPQGPCPTPIPGDTLQLGRTYSLAGEDTFTKDAPAGSFAQPNVPNASYLSPIYTGDHGMGWSAYPDGWPSTYTAASGVEGYQPSTVLSVHDGTLDFYLHDDAQGNPVGADVSPWPGGREYQTYGAYSLCEKVTPASDSYGLDNFYEASLLWPQNDSDGPCAESDFPETYWPIYDSLTNTILNGGTLNNDAVYAFAHYGTWSAQTGCQKYPPPPDSSTTPINLFQWHVYTQEWGPGYRSYYVDGKYLYTSTSQVWSQPERWQLQIEPSPSAEVQNNGGGAHVYIAWVWIGKPDY
jgi:hypothetical protein